MITVFVYMYLLYGLAFSDLHLAGYLQVPSHSRKFSFSCRMTHLMFCVEVYCFHLAWLRLNA